MNNRRLEIIEGDCVEAMAAMEAESVDAIVCDPPYGISFMGREFDTFKPGDLKDKREKDKARVPREDGRKVAAWSNAGDAGSYDYRISANRTFQEWTRLWAVEALRVLKPGGWAAVFGGTRTAHRMICGLEDAGFEIRDCVSWNYGSGFPKSLDISAAIDAGACRAELEKRLGRAPTRDEFKAAWKTFREVVGKQKMRELPNDVPFGQGLISSHADAIAGRRTNSQVEIDITVPATDAAKEHEGKGTALKPAWEPICLARKPLAGTVAENVLRYGTGGLNIEACRVGTTKRVPGGLSQPDQNPSSWSKGGSRPEDSGQDPNIGRWPANLVLDEEAAEMLDEQSGDLGVSSGGRIGNAGGGAVENIPTSKYRKGDPGFGDSGGASRFFYTAKTSRGEREAGLRGFIPCGKCGGLDSLTHTNEKGDEVPCIRNGHPTVKNVALMKWLARLVTPPKVFDIVCESCYSTSRGGTGGRDGDSDLRAVREVSQTARPSDEVLLGCLPGEKPSSTPHGLSDVRADTVARERKILLQKLSDSRDACSEDALSKTVRELQRNIPSQEGQRQEILRSALCGEVDGDEKKKTVFKDAPRISDAVQAGTSDGDEGRVRDGASADDGGAPQQGAPRRRSGPSSKREKGRQPGGESGPPNKGTARQAPETPPGKKHRVPALSQENQVEQRCPKCRGRLIRVERPGLILDPFVGSGTTGMACSIEGFDFIGCEKEAEYAEIARRRIEYARANPRAFDEGVVRPKPEKVVAGQGNLFQEMVAGG